MNRLVAKQTDKARLASFFVGLAAVGVLAVILTLSALGWVPFANADQSAQVRQSVTRNADTSLRCDEVVSRLFLESQGRGTSTPRQAVEDYLEDGRRFELGQRDRGLYSGAVVESDPDPRVVVA